LWLTSVVALSIGRIFLHRIEKNLYRSGRDLRNAVIVGNTETADRIYETLSDHPLLGYRLLGYFADRPGSGGALSAQSTCLGTLERLPDALIDKNVELVLLALNHDDHPNILKLVQDCEGIDVEFLM